METRPVDDRDRRNRTELRNKAWKDQLDDLVEAYLRWDKDGWVEGGGESDADGDVHNEVYIVELKGKSSTK